MNRYAHFIQRRPKGLHWFSVSSGLEQRTNWLHKSDCSKLRWKEYKNNRQKEEIDLW